MFKISERHWAWLGRVAILVTILGGPTILLGYCHHNPSASLIAKVEYGAFSLPDDIEQADKALADAMSSAALTEQLRSKFPDEKAPLERFAYAISAYLLENRWNSRAGNAKSAKTLCVATVTNEGDRVAKSVVLELPGSEAARITRSNGTSKFISAAGPYEIGDLSPQESLTVLAWAYSTPYNEPKLVHADGIGKVLLYQPMSPFWNSLRRNLVWAPMIVWLLVVVCLGLYGFIRNVKAQRVQR